jgi:hypothetical protein
MNEVLFPPPNEHPRAKFSGVRALWVVAVLVVLAVTLSLAGWLFWRPEAISEQLTSPGLLLQAIGQPRSLYFNGSAHPWLLRQRLDVLGAEDKNPLSARCREMAQAVQEPQLFRKLDRESRFDAVLLVGDPSEYPILIKHLRSTGDWSVRYLDHSGILFQRQREQTWTPLELDALRAQFASDAEWGVCLALAAQKMLALGMSEDALVRLDEAARLAPRSAAVWAARAHYHVARSQWHEARAAADCALGFEAKNLSALSALVQIHFAGNRFDEAYRVSGRLVELRPGDPGLLFHHAKVAHQAHAFRAEAEVLERLVRKAEAEGRSSSGYRIYLGQAYAAMSEAAPAAEQFEKVLADPSLSPEQRQFSTETLERIRRRTGL